jgi:hypothetical protein
MKMYWGVFSTSALDGGEWSDSRSDQFISEAGWTSVSVSTLWRREKILMLGIEI